MFLRGGGRKTEVVEEPPAVKMTGWLKVWSIVLPVAIIGIAVLNLVTRSGAKRTKAIIKTEEDAKELHRFTCENCGYTIFPARGREGKFFGDDFECPVCGAKKEHFYDGNDPDDPHNKAPEEGESAPDKKPAEGAKAEPAEGVKAETEQEKATEKSADVANTKAPEQKEEVRA